MRILVIFIVLVLTLYAAQTSFLTYIEYNGVSANLMLLLTVSAAFIRGPFFAVTLGFCVGLLQDLTSGDFFGCATFSYMTIGVIFGKFSERVVKDQFLIPIVSAPVATAIYFFMTAGFIHLLGYPLDIEKAVNTNLVPLLFYQTIFALPIHKIAYDFDKSIISS